jgi:hypothetical protein
MRLTTKPKMVLLLPVIAVALSITAMPFLTANLFRKSHKTLEVLIQQTRLFFTPEQIKDKSDSVNDSVCVCESIQCFLL